MSTVEVVRACRKIATFTKWETRTLLQGQAHNIHTRSGQQPCSFSFCKNGYFDSSIFFFLVLFIKSTQLARQVQQERTQMECSNAEDWNRPCSTMLDMGALARYGHCHDRWGQEYRCVKLTSTTQSKMSMISTRWSWPPLLLLWILSTFQAQKSLTGRSRYQRVAPPPFPRTRILSTSGASRCCASFPLVECHGEARTCYSCNFSSSKALVFHGNVMTKKRSRLTCDDVEELVYLHKVLPQVREWEVVKKMHLKWFFWYQWSTFNVTFNVLSCLLFPDCETPSWFWLSKVVFRLSFSLCIHTHIYIFTIVVCYISWYWTGLGSDQSVFAMTILTLLFFCFFCFVY